MSKSLDMRNVLRTIIITAYSISFFYIGFTDIYRLFVHPRMLIFIRMAAVFFLLMAFFSVKKVTRKITTEKMKIPYILYTVPIILITLITSLNSIDGNVAGKKDINLIRNVQSTDYVNYSREDILIIKDGQFLAGIDMLYSNLDNYLNKKVLIEGFIYKQDDFEKDHFVIGRYIISCCVADSQVVGLLSKLHNNRLPENEWYSVIGTIQKKELNDRNIPIIEVEKINKIKAPDSPYVFLNS